MTCRDLRFAIPVLCTVLLAACGSSSSGGQGGTGAGATGAGGGSGSGTGGTTGGAPKMCTSSSNTCTSAEINTYSNCVLAACDTDYKTCLGPNYKTGSYSGVCATYVGCINACACNDTACSTACGLPDTSCETCLSQIATCSSTCTLPACYLTTGAGGTSGGLGGSTGTVVGGTCADLLACCNASSASLKATCMQAYTSEMQLGGDLACGVALSTLKSTFCP